MKITHCIFTMETGGTQMLIVDMLNKLSINHTVSLIIVNNEWDKTIIASINPEIPIFFINRKKGSKSLIPLIKLNYILWKSKPDIVHCHEPNMGNFLYYKGYKNVLTIHDVGRIVSNLNKYDGFTAISNAVAEDFNGRYNLNIPVVNNGIDISAFKHRVDFQYAKPADTFKIIQVSRLVHLKKGQDILLTAVAQLMGRQLIPQITIDLAGGGESLDYLQNLVKELKIDDKVNFIGNKDRRWLMDNLKEYHLLVQPSRYEGFGLTVIEGMAAKIPVLASNLDGPAEILKNCQCNFLFESENVDDCASKISMIAEQYVKNQIKDVVANNFSVASQRYSTEAMVDSYMKIYNGLLMETSQ